MKIKYITFIFVFIFSLSFAQNKNRIEISGQIIANSLDVEGVTIFNKTGGIGAISNIEGQFKINVYLNDVIEIAAIQFQKITLTIDENIMKSKMLTVVLVEQVNELDEIVILPFGLTGSLNEDIASTKILKPNYDALYFGLANSDQFEFADDFESRVNPTSELNQTITLYSGIDVIGLVNLIAKQKKNNKKEITNNRLNFITNKYSESYLKERLAISSKEVQSLLYFVQDNDFDVALLDDKNEFKFLDYMIQQRDIFQQKQNAKN